MRPRGAEAGTKPSQLGLVHWCPEIRKIKNVNLTCQTLRHERPRAVLNTPKWFQKWKMHSLSERSPGGRELGLDSCLEQRFDYLQDPPSAWEAVKLSPYVILGLFVCCCCSVAKLCPALCDPVAYSPPGSLSSTISWSLLKFMFIESVMLSNHFILCSPLLLLPSSVTIFFKGGRALYQNYLNSWFCF